LTEWTNATGLTPAVAASYKEAAEVCLSRHHVPPVVELTLSDDDNETPAELAWSLPDMRARDAWANAIDATEAGAYCCVIAGVEEIRELFAVRRAETGTGSDYYIGPSGAGVNDLEDCLRLEVSGVDSGDRRDVVNRLLEKISASAGRQEQLASIGRGLWLLRQAFNDSRCSGGAS
jgi:hypothetical protein